MVDGLRHDTRQPSDVSATRTFDTDQALMKRAEVNSWIFGGRF